MKATALARPLVVGLPLALGASPALASYAFYVGKNLSETGATFVGGTGAMSR